MILDSRILVINLNESKIDKEHPLNYEYDM